MSADEAIQDILNFVYEDSEDEESDLDELYSEEEKSTDGDIEENSESDITSEEEINVEAPTERRKQRRKQLTYTRNVHSIESALEEDNYELLPIPRQENTIEGFFPDYDDNGKLKKEKKVKQFTNIPQNKTARQSACDIITNKPCVAPGFRETETEKYAFDLLFTMDMLKRSFFLSFNLKNKFNFFCRYWASCHHQEEENDIMERFLQ